MHLNEGGHVDDVAGGAQDHGEALAEEGSDGGGHEHKDAYAAVQHGEGEVAEIAGQQGGDIVLQGVVGCEEE